MTSRRDSVSGLLFAGCLDLTASILLLIIVIHKSSTLLTIITAVLFSLGTVSLGVAILTLFKGRNK